MTELKRSYPYPRQLLLNGVYDLTEGTGGKIQKLAEEGEILGEREVYGNKSTFLFALSGTEDSCTLQIGVYCPCRTYADYVFHSVKVEKFVTVNSDRGHSHAACHHGNSLSVVISRVALNATHVVYQFCVGKEVFGNKFGTQRISRHKYGFCEIAFFCSNVRGGNRHVVFLLYL